MKSWYLVRPFGKMEIEKAIVGAGAVVVLLSPNSKKSPWVRREIGYAEDNGKRIFPILVAGNERNSVPIRLTNHQRVDIRQFEDTGLRSLSLSLSNHLGVPKLQEQKVLATPDQILQQKLEINKALREKIEREAERIAG